MTGRVILSRYLWQSPIEGFNYGWDQTSELLLRVIIFPQDKERMYAHMCKRVSESNYSWSSRSETHTYPSFSNCLTPLVDCIVCFRFCLSFFMNILCLYYILLLSLFIDINHKDLWYTSNHNYFVFVLRVFFSWKSLYSSEIFNFYSTVFTYPV